MIAKQHNCASVFCTRPTMCARKCDRFGQDGRMNTTLPGRAFRVHAHGAARCVHARALRSARACTQRAAPCACTRNARPGSVVFMRPSCPNLSHFRAHIVGLVQNTLAQLCCFAIICKYLDELSVSIHCISPRTRRAAASSPAI